MSNTITTNLWASGLASLDCKLDDDQITLLKRYIELLVLWNKTYNLTAIRDSDEMIPLHIFDSLAVANFIKGNTCLDVGSGAGLPTIPLAIIQPNRQFTALDTNGKKTRFIQQAVIELGLKNVSVKQERIEKWQSEIKFDAIISRAFSSIHDFVKPSSKHLKDDGVLYAMKGQFPEKEMSNLNDDFRLIATHQLEVPFVEGERNLLVITKNYHNQE